MAGFPQDATDHAAARGGVTMLSTAPPHLVLIARAPAALTALGDLCENAGYAVTATTVVPRSVTQLRATRPALVLLELSERDWGEWALLDALRQPGPLAPLPCILLAMNPRLLAEAEARFGPAHLRALAQPLDRAQLLATVEELLGAR